MASLADAQKYIADSNSGKVMWDDNQRSAMNNIISGAGGGGGNGGGGGFNTQSIVDSAKQLNDLNIQANQPAIASYQASKAPLKQQYDDLLASIKTNQGVAENRQTTTTRNMLGARGVDSTLGVGATEMTNAVNPITQQYTQQAKDTTNTENTAMSDIDKAIATLQSGNMPAAISSSESLASAQQSANQFQQTMDASQKQQAITNAAASQAASNPTQTTIESNGHRYLVSYDSQGNVTNKVDLGSVSATASGGSDALNYLQTLFG